MSSSAFLWRNQQHHDIVRYEDGSNKHLERTRHLSKLWVCSKHYDELEEELDDDMKRRTMHLSSADAAPHRSAAAEKQQRRSNGQVLAQSGTLALEADTTARVMLKNWDPAMRRNLSRHF